jgi:dTDP-4-amino-4,6-dideoxy-D-galactose acyltransferase
MTGLVEPLAWDSEFFGLPIARVALDGATPETLREIETEARDLGIACLYGSLDPVALDTAYLVQTLGYRLVEVAQLLSRPADLPYTPKPTVSVVRRGGVADLPLLEEPIVRLAPWSRFAADPRFGPDAARRMFRAWVERAARDGEEYMLLISEDDEGVNGLSTHVRSPVPCIDLCGVTKPGTGAAQALMAGFFEWGAGHALHAGNELLAGPVAARNVAVLRYCEGCGFMVTRTRYLFHRWLDEDAGHR